MEFRESLLHSPLDFKHQMIELGSSSISLPSCHLIYGIIIKDGPSLGLGGTCPPPPKFWKKKFLVCVYTKKIFNLPQNMQSWPPPSKKIINWLMKSKSICSILSILPSWPKNNYNNLWIITKKNTHTHKFDPKKPNGPKNNMNYQQTKKPDCLKNNMNYL